MPFINAVTSVGTTAVAIATPGAVPDNIGVLVQNLGSVTVYLGGSTVTADTTSTGGFQVAANAIVNVPVTGAAAETLYARTASSTANVATLYPG
jgi:hypothetical protein